MSKRRRAAAIRQLRARANGPNLTRTLWSQFINALWTLLKDFFQVAQSSLAAEARVFDMLRDVPSTVRSYESSPCDGAFVIIPPGTPKRDRPPANASRYEFWTWAEQQDNLEFVTFDVKYIALRPRAVDSDYRYSTSTRKPRTFSAEIYLLAFEHPDLVDYIAVVPKTCWEVPIYDFAKGMDVLMSKAPAWCQPFMVHQSHLKIAVERILKAARSSRKTRPRSRSYWYTNPTTGVRLAGWKPRAKAKPPIGPQLDLDRLIERSYNHMIKFWQDIASAGCRVVWNDCAPLLFDYFLAVEGHGLFRVEQKSVACSSHVFKFEQGRDGPLQSRRCWDVLFVQCTDGLMCITRDAIKPYRNLRLWLTPGFRRRHIFQDDDESSAVAKAVEHIIHHGNAARAAADAAMSRLRPREVMADAGVKVKMSHIVAAMVRLPERHKLDDPLAFRTKEKQSLSWIAGQLNSWCRRRAYGLCLALHGGHVLGTHVFIEHHWSADELDAYDRCGELPFSIFTDRARDKRCIVLRFHNFASSSGIGGDLTVRKEHWQPPVRNVQHVIIANVLDQAVSEDFSKANSWYMVLPSSATSMFADGNETISKPPLAQKSTGQHLVRQPTVLAGFGPKGKSAMPFGPRFLKDGSDDPSKYILNAHDGTIYEQLCDILRIGGEFAIRNPQARGVVGQKFSKEQYHLTIRQVQQAAWDYGYANRDFHVRPRGYRKFKHGLLKRSKRSWRGRYWQLPADLYAGRQRNR